MNDPFAAQQWHQGLDALHQCGRHHGDALGHAERFQHQAADFASKPPPDRYAALLIRVAEACQLATQWQKACRHQEDHEAFIDETANESFPASDRPA